MSEVQDAIDVSSALDDGLGRLGAEHKSQERVHAALANKRQMTWAKPDPELAARVMLRASLVRPARRPRQWPLAVAAGFVLAGGLSWVAYLKSAPAPTSGLIVGEGPVGAPGSSGGVENVKVKNPPPAIDLAMLTRLPARSEPKIAASLEQPMLREARAIREDTQRGFEAVMARLPVSVDFSLSSSTR